MKVVECPNCQSKFKIDESIIKKESVKLRCSVCSHVFVHQMKDDLSLEEEFESLLSGENPEPYPEDLELDSSADSFSAEEQKLDETPDSFDETEPDFAPESLTGSQPESVIREIDSILGAGDDAGTYKSESFLLDEGETKSKRRYWIWGLLFIIIAAGAGAGWMYRDTIQKMLASKEPAQNLVRGPFFEIEDKDITYEFANNSQDGAMLIVKGIVQKVSERPLKSLQVEARIYGEGKKLIDTKTVYAGIVPLQDELITKKKEEIETLLDAEPNSIGALAVANEIPFVAVFFGKAAQAGTSIHVEVKDYHW